MHSSVVALLITFSAAPTAGPPGHPAFELAYAVQQDRVVGSVRGQVKEAGTGRPLVGAQMSIQGTGLGGITGADGRYRIDNVPAGQVTVRAQLLGFTVLSNTVTVSNGQMATLDFELHEQPLRLDEVVVTGLAGAARRREVGNAIAQINVAEVPEPI